MSTPITSTNRPNPVDAAIRKVVGGIASVVAVVSGLGTAGVLSGAQVGAVNSYAGELTSAISGPISLAAGAVVGLVSGGAVLFGALRAGRNATDDTTPLSDPRDRDNALLVRADGLPLGGNPLGQGRRLATEHAGTVPDGGPTTERFPGR